MLNNQKHIKSGFIGSSNIKEGDLTFSTGEVSELRKSLENEIHLKKVDEEVNNIKKRLLRSTNLEIGRSSDIFELQKMFEEDSHQKKQKLEEEVTILQSQLSQLTMEENQPRNCLE